MFSATKLAANRIGSKIASQLSRQQRLVPRETRVACYKIDRAFLSTPSLDDDDDDFTPQSPAEITLEIAEGIADTTQFYMRHGLSRQRLEFLAKTEQPVLHKWQKMMEVFLMTQVHVIGSIGYVANEQGLSKYAQDLQACLQKADSDVQQVLTDIRRDTWREMVATAFALDVADIPTLSIVDARNHMHKVASKMMEPSVLLEIQTKTSKINNDDAEVELQLKHQVLQNVIINQVYLGGSPSLVEELGFGSGGAGYAKMQCAMSDHEGDPLVGEYAAAAMVRIWQAAGIDISSVTGAGPAGGPPPV